MKLQIILSIIALPCLVLAEQQKTVILVIGSGRSGTSATTGILDIMGLELGSPLSRPNEFNKKGGFEHQPTVAVNHNVFKALNMHAHSPKYTIDFSSVPFSVINDIKFNIKNSFGQYSIFGIKDPHISYILPLYLPVLKEMGYKVKLLIVLRDPEKIVGSFKHRYPEENEVDFYNLVCVCMMALLEHTEGTDKLIIRFEDLLTNTKNTIDKIHAFIPELHSYDEVSDEITTFLETDLLTQKKVKKRFKKHTKE